uniref:Uncharacterized protein n=1 Tax=Arundo donax TaxID=35708 RepID=A0A0A9CAH1_ARUDO
MHLFDLMLLLLLRNVPCDPRVLKDTLF